MTPTQFRSMFSAAGLCLGLAPGVGAQTAWPLSQIYDKISAPSASPLPGLAGGFRQQILVADARLVGLRGKELLGLRFRRDQGFAGRQIGGEIDVVVRLSPAALAPEKASETFAQNESTSMQVLRGRVTIPHSPPYVAASKPWSGVNSFGLTFASPYVYSGGDLCIDIEGRPVKNREPKFWAVDHELGSLGGSVASIGRGCSPFVDLDGEAQYANATLLQIGSSMNVFAWGRRGASPLLLLGASPIPGGLELASIGAPGCFQYVNPIAIFGLSYGPYLGRGGDGVVAFQPQIPATASLLSAKFYTQFADLENRLPKPWSNPIGLTTTNALELRLPALGPALGMSTVRSALVSRGVPMPATGAVDVETGPVMRVIHR